MSKTTTSQAVEPECLPSADETFVPLSYGAILTEARKSLNLSIADVAAELQLKSQTIMSLEAEEPEKGVSKVFYRGYLRAYAKRLGLSPEDIVSMCEPSQQSSCVNMKSFSRKVERQTTDRRINYVSLAIVFAVILSLAVAYFQKGESTQSVSEYVTQLIDTTLSSDPTEVVEEPDVADEFAALSGDVAIVTSAKQTNQQTLQPETIQVINEQQKTLPSQSTVLIAPSDSQPKTDSVIQEQDELVFDNTHTNPPKTVSLELSFSGDCWMELVDFTGDKVAYGIKESGRVVKVSGVPPFQLTLGAPEFVQITYGGEVINMKKYRAGRTARITLPVI